MKYLIFAMLFAGVSAFAESDAGYKALGDALAPWAPEFITIDGEQLKVILSSQRITQQMYSAVIKTGACAAVWSFGGDALPGVSNIAVVNSFAKQGYLFEGGAAECTALGKLSSDASRIYMLERTRVY
ncbi:hypothetical protein P886_3770 [Alteromonadaceae bacterium 2753L.S.0a.02]|nr:hypothetical protein P886_3770 [Alteromonadaceae bacterium 2753L.S.0a.02]